MAETTKSPTDFPTNVPLDLFSTLSPPGSDQLWLNTNGSNTTGWDNETSFCVPYQQKVYPIVLPIMLVACLLSVLFNLVIFLSAHWCRRPMSPTLYLSISLAMADAFASLNLAVGLIINSLLPCLFGIRSDNVCFNLAVEATRLAAILITVMHLLALGVNHWIGIHRPIHYASIMTRRVAWIIIGVCWIGPFTLVYLYFFAHSNQGFRSENCQINFFLDQIAWRSIFAASFFIPFLVMSIIYSTMYSIVKAHNRNRQQYQEGQSNNQQLHRNVRAVVTTGFILGSYIVGWMPGVLWYVLVCRNCALQLTDLPLEVIVPLSVTFNSLIILKALVNPIIYAARMSDIQSALKKMKFELVELFCASCIHQDIPQINLGGSIYGNHSGRGLSRGSVSSTRRGQINASGNAQHIHGDSGQNGLGHHSLSNHNLPLELQEIK